MEDLNEAVSKLRVDFVKDNSDLLIEMVADMDIPEVEKEAAVAKFKTMTAEELEVLA